jgi:hypothetical protein
MDVCRKHGRMRGQKDETVSPGQGEEGADEVEGIHFIPCLSLANDMGV